jgi:hypothetical protein
MCHRKRSLAAIILTASATVNRIRKQTSTRIDFCFTRSRRRRGLAPSRRSSERWVTTCDYGPERGHLLAVLPWTICTCALFIQNFIFILRPSLATRVRLSRRYPFRRWSSWRLNRGEFANIFPRPSTCRHWGYSTPRSEITPKNICSAISLWHAICDLTKECISRHVIIILPDYINL